MWRPSRTLASAVLTSVAVSATASAATPPEDQAAADVAIGEYDARMTAVGWERQPPQPMQPLEESHINLGAVVVEDPMSCVDPDRIFNFEHGLEGETARAMSPVFEWASDDDVVDGPAAFAGTRLSFATVATVDATHVWVIDGFIDRLTSKVAYDCLDAKFTQAVADTPGANGPFTAPEVVLDVDPDVTVGDHSGSVSMGLSSDTGVATSRVTLDMHVARTDRSLVVVIDVYFGAGEPSGGDALADLAAIVESLRA